MHRRLSPAVCLALSALASWPLAGCKTGPYVNAHIETLNAEFRQLEDYVYCLEEENSRLTQELEAARDAKQPTTNQRRSPRTPFLRPTEDPPGLDVPSVEMPADPANSPPRRSNRPAIDPPAEMDLAPPTVELPQESDELPKPAAPGAAKPLAPEPLKSTKPADTKVTHLFLNPVLTGGSDLDGQPGDDGLSVVIEPRSADDELVPQAGSVSVVVLDPTKAGDAARVARWDFAASEVQQKLSTTSAAPGIRLQMPWPATPPANDKLHLFIRYETTDGRRLQTDREIFVGQARQLSQRWTPRKATSPVPAEPAKLPVAATQPGPAPAVSAAVPAWSPNR